MGKNKTVYVVTKESFKSREKYVAGVFASLPLAEKEVDKIAKYDRNSLWFVEILEQPLIEEE